MGSSSRPCLYDGCTKKGAFSFNNLCNDHWNVRIDENIKEFVAEHHRKIADQKKEPL